MAPLEKFKSVKGKKLCYNCLRDDQFTSKCNSKYTCFKEGCFVKHNKTLHDYFLLKQNKRKKDSHVKDGSKSTKKEGESIKINTYKTRKANDRVFLKITPVKVMKNDGETISTFALLDNCSQSTLIRKEDFAKQMKLKGYSRKTNKSKWNWKGILEKQTKAV